MTCRFSDYFFMCQFNSSLKFNGVNNVCLKLRLFFSVFGNSPDTPKNKSKNINT